MKPGNIYLVRHGETRFNAGSRGKDPILRGWIDVPLDPAGRAQAQALRPRLQKVNSPNVVHSDLKRTIETSQIIFGKDSGKAADIRLRPWNVGDLAGHKESQVRPAVNYYLAHPERRTPNGESYNEFERRWFKALKFYAQSPGDTVLVVSHSNVLALKNLRKKDFLTGPPPPGSVTVIPKEKALHPKRGLL